ncbi:MAG TPA: hypothetical protein VEQ63_05190 [Bryobacteraceae bacterium]|nr:hypothetical protein [Bryobacteraceae bacterium]
MQDRALAISREIQAKHLPYGTVLNPMYVSAASEQLITYTRCADSAIWTGHYLAAEAFRYAVTKSPDSLAAALQALQGIRYLVEVTGPHNLLARCVLPTDSPYSFGPRSEEAHHKEYLGKIEGRDYYWIGNTSRDQFMGVFFGLSVAYEHLTDPAVRDVISGLVTRLIDRLRDNDWDVKMPDGSTSTVFWHRPDQQLAILQVGRQVNPARFSAPYNGFRSLIGVGLPMAFEARDPHDSYFKFNLAAITFYNLLRLEAKTSSRYSDYLDAYKTFRSATAGHGNAFFNLVDRALQGPNGARDVETAGLLSAWLLRPTRDDFVDLRGKYDSCGSDRACQVIPVPERVRTDFLWQRSPFLLYGGGDGKIEAPGIDFILPYWMGRYYGMDFTLVALSAASGDTRLAPGSLAAVYAAAFPSVPQVSLRDSAGIVHPISPFFTSMSQLNFVLPSAASLGPAQLTISGADAGSPTHTSVIALERVAPALFAADSSGKGPAAATALRVESGGRQQGLKVFTCAGPSLCFTEPLDVRANSPVYVSLYGTGVRNRSSLSVSVGGAAVPVLYSGAQPDYAGLDQINIELPGNFRTTGKVDVVVTADGIRSNAVQIEVE